MASVHPVINHGVKKWRLRYVDDFGKTKTRIFSKKKEADSALLEYKNAKSTGIPVGTVNMSFKDLAEEFMVAAAQGTRDNKEPLGPQTLRSYRGYLTLHILPLYGAVDAGTIDPRVVRTMRDAVVGRFNNRTSAQQCFQIIKAVLTYGTERGYFQANPATKITIRSTRSEEEHVVIPSQEEIRKLKETAYFLRDGHQHEQVRCAWKKYSALFLVLLMTGIRAGEARALKVKDVATANLVLKIRRSADSRNGDILPPKRQSKRDIPFSKEVLDALTPLLKKHGELYVFAGAQSGSIPAHSHIYKLMWVRLLKEAGVKHYKLHHLRHYYASRLISEGVDIKKVSTWMGHKSVAFTLQTYGHLIPGEQRDGYDDVVF